MASDPGPSPTLRRRRLAALMRKLREESGLTRDEVARRLEWSPSKMTRIESAQFVRLPPRDVRDLLDVYGITGESEREGLIQLAREARQRGWWRQYGDVLQDWLQVFVGLEAEASEIRTYHAQVVPGLMQTEDYARHVARAGLVKDAEEIERRVDARLIRQERLFRPEGPKIWAILDEAVLCRVVGGREVMRLQLERLLEFADLENVEIQILPYSTGAHPAVDGSFTVLGFSEASDPDVVYLEHWKSALFVESPEEVVEYDRMYTHLNASALSTGDSVEMIAAIAKAL
ncbi:MAG: helix-turn-helix domain-containing protein [Streptosporangiales bacterium]|nr:helix-turn-helix domain-containing protein [Streptosporangiales bacterium]